MTATDVLTPADPAEMGMSAERLADATALMQHQFDAGRSPMLAAVVARHGRVVFTHAVGDQRPGGPPLTVDSIFPLASQTKPLTAAVVLCLVERGLVGITEPAARILPELEDDHGDVLVHHLLTHTSGWHDDDVVAVRDQRLQDLIDGFLTGDDRQTGDLLSHIQLAAGWEVPRRLALNEQMQYCGLNYTLLGEIVRRVTGGTLDAAMREFLFEPLGMASTTLIVGDDLADRVVERPPGIPYGPEHDFAPISFNHPLLAASDGGDGAAFGSSRDLTRFGQMLLDGGVLGGVRVLSADAVRVMSSDRIPGIACEAMGQQQAAGSWGYGMGVGGAVPWLYFGGGTVAPGKLFHGGAGICSLWVDPDTGIVGAYFEAVTEVNEFQVPLSAAEHRFEDVVTSAVLD